MKTKMVVAGVMSGTSADGVDVVFVLVRAGLASRGQRTTSKRGQKLEVLGHAGFAYPKVLRAEVMRAMEGVAMPAGAFSGLNWKLGEFYAACVTKAVAKFGVKIELVGLHGQTVFHDAAGGRTWQMGEAAVLRERLGVPVVSDFRPADVAAGGQGAPLVPMLDFFLFRHPTLNRVLLNLGGIANLTAIPAGAGLEEVLAFDTGPANMVVDALMMSGFDKGFDHGGKVAARGRVLPEVVAEVMREGYFGRLPPKSCGREEFGVGFTERFRALCEAARGDVGDAVATATELTAASVLGAYGQFCRTVLDTRGGQAAPAAKGTEVIVAGGGVKNRTLMKRLGEGFGALGVTVRGIEEFGVSAQAKEAVAFALLAWLTWHGLPGNVPAATGARGARVLGKVCGFAE